MAYKYLCGRLRAALRLQTLRELGPEGLDHLCVLVVVLVQLQGKACAMLKVDN
jgi:hypothetical protein